VTQAHLIEERVVLREYAKPRVNLVGRRIFCLLSVLFAGGFYFFLNLLDNYWAVGDGVPDIFFLNSVLQTAFDVLTAGAALAFVVGLLRRQKRSVLACRFLFVTCAALSLWFRVELIYLSDRVFLSLNEPSFRNKILSAGAGASTVVLHWESSADLYAVFVYSGSRSLPDGRMSREAIDAFADLEELKGCRFYSRHLRDEFYTIYIYCR
jgi:hypothetical protein